MSRKLSLILSICVCFLGTMASLWGQNASAVHGIMGYLDPRTGAFHPMAQATTPDDLPPATSTFTGKIVANFTITVDSTIVSTTKIGCNISASLDDVSAANIIIEEAGSAVARGSGSTVTCTATIPYSWKLASASTDRISLSYSVQVPVAETSLSATYPNRLSSQSLGTISVPATGTTTTETIAVTI